MLYNFSLSSGYIVSHCSSIYTSLVSIDVEHLIMCSVGIHIASLMKGLFFFCLFCFYWVILSIIDLWEFFMYSGCKSFFGSLPFNCLSDILINKLIKCNLLKFFFFHGNAFSVLRNHCLLQGHEIFFFNVFL